LVKNLQSFAKKIVHANLTKLLALILKTVDCSAIAAKTFFTFSFKSMQKKANFVTTIPIMQYGHYTFSI